MRSVWHPLSTLFLTEPRCFATPRILRMLLGAEGRVELIYAGDRMEPTIRHGDRVTIDGCDPAGLRNGVALVICADGIPDLLRIVERDGDRLSIAADADPSLRTTAPVDAILGIARVPADRCRPAVAALRRLRIDVGEAWNGRPDAHPDAAGSVLEKYDSQAPFYAESDREDIDPDLLDRVTRGLEPGCRVLVVGSGTGRESFALAGRGFQVSGVEFSPSMVELAHREAQRRGLAVEFHESDIRAHEIAHGTLGGVFFTYDVYSFLPRAGERVEVLRRIRSWLGPDGRVFLSARRVRSWYERSVLSLQWLARLREGGEEWGDSHTRWIGNDGSLRRSFVHVFPVAGLKAEIAAAGFRLEEWSGGHGTLTADIIEPLEGR